MIIHGKKIKVEYQETFNDRAVFGYDRLPVLKHLTEGCSVEFAQLLKAGRLEDGREFQEIRVVIRKE